MTMEEIWLATNSNEVSNLISSAADNTPRFNVRVLTIDEFLNSDPPREADQPAAVFVDLIDFQAWDRLSECRRRWLNSISPFIGVHDSNGLPLDNLLAASRVHSRFINHDDVTGQALIEVVRSARSEDLSTCKLRMDGTKIVTCGDRRFVSCSGLGQSVFDDIEIVARHDIAVLLVGETGTGKTSIARIIHDLSPRHGGNLIHVACGALPRDLIDSELFGHVKGAFTGAHESRIGKFEAAIDGTILLDEIDTLDLEQQAKLLRILESNEFEKLGSHKTQTSNARVIVASNVSLEDLVAAGRFRADLYYRLNQVKFQIPSLRERLNDLPYLVREILNEFKVRHAFNIDAVTPEFLNALLRYPWPGNIRELRNEIRRAALYCLNGVIDEPCLNAHIRDYVSPNQESGRSESGLSSFVEKTEREAIEEMLGMQEYNRTATAKALGISRVTLYKKIRKYGIRLDD